MKLTAEQVEKIEDLVETAGRFGQRAAIIKFGLRDVSALASFMSVMRSIGVAAPPKWDKSALSPEDKLAFAAWLQERKVAPHA